MSTPAELYRNAIDLNRYSNSVAKRITRTYNNAIKESMQQLAALDAEPSATKSARLRAILANLKGSLDGWAGTSTALSVKELQELVELQAGFVSRILEGEVPENLRFQVQNVQISPQFAEAVATIDPTTYNVVTLSDDLGAAVTGTPKPFKLDLGGGSTITLPNGAGLATSFKRLAGKQAEIFTKEVQNGLILGESSPKIARRLRRQLTQVPGNQIRAMVHTSVNQVANAASQAVYSQNQDITKKYRYVSTLDTRTSAICRALDGTEHFYGKGPTPPQHFNCRSTTVPIVDYEGLGLAPPPPSKIKRPNSDKSVSDNETYGAWLKGQPRDVQEKVLGDKGQVGYFNALSRKYGPDGAIRRFVREDGSEKTIDDLKRAYGPVSSIKPKPKPKPKPKAKPQTPRPKTAVPAQAGRDYIEAHQWDNGKNKLSHKAIADSLELVAQEKSLSGQHMRQLMEFQRKKEVQTVWSTGREKLIGTKDFDHWGDTEIIAALRKGQGKGKEVVMAIADDLEKGRKHPFMNSIAKVSSGAAGHTVEATHLIVLKQESQFKQLTAAGVARVRESSRASVRASVNGNPMKVTGADLYKRTGKTTWKTDEGWINTYVHEMGHQVHFRAGKPSIAKHLTDGIKDDLDWNSLSEIQKIAEIKKRNWYPSQYGMTNELEQFAETFTQYVFAPDELKKANSAAYQWVENAMKEALK